MALPWEDFQGSDQATATVDSPPWESFQKKPWEAFSQATEEPQRASPIIPGNIDLGERPIVHNQDGSISTVRSISINQDGKEYLIPTVAKDGSKLLSNAEAVDQFHKTGEHLGAFKTAADATNYAKFLHNEQASTYVQPKADIPSQVQDVFDQSAGQQQIERTAPDTAPQIAQNAAQGLLESAKGFVPTTLGQAAAMASPAVGGADDLTRGMGAVKDWINGKPLSKIGSERFPESQILKEAEKTPPYSKERFKTGFDIVSQLLMAGGIAHSLSKAEPNLPTQPEGGDINNEQGTAGRQPQESFTAETQRFAPQSGEVPETRPENSGTTPQGTGRIGPDGGQDSGGAPEASGQLGTTEGVRVGAGQEGQGSPNPQDQHSPGDSSIPESTTGLPPDRNSGGDASGVSQEPDVVQSNVPVTESPELGLVDKIKRVAQESGATQPQNFGFTGGGTFRNYVKSWTDRLKSVVRLGESIKRYAAIRPLKNEIAATYDAIDNHAGMTARHAGNSVRLNLPALTDLADQAATFVRQAAGDRSGMTAKLTGIRGKGYDAVIDYAIRNWEKLESAVKAAKSATDTVYNAQNAAGIDFGYREGYVKGIYEDDLQPASALDKLRGSARGSTSHVRSKVFNDYADAIAAGFKPKDLRLSKLTESSVRNGIRLVNGQAWGEGLGELKAPDGTPIAKPMESVEGRKSDGSIVQRQVAPQGYLPVEISRGNTIAVHEDAASLVKKLTGTSEFSPIASNAAAFVKHNMVAFDIYHGSRFGQMQMAFEGLLKPSYHKGLALLEYSDGDLSKAIKAGEISQAEANWAKAKRPIVEGGIKSGVNIGRIYDALFRETAPLFPYAKKASNWIFGKLSRGVITQSYVYAFERNSKLHPDWSGAKVHSYTAREINTYYRNMGNQGLFKSKTIQDAARFFTFAPQWFEGKARSEGRGYGQISKAAINPLKAGNVAKGMGTGLVAYFAANQLVNMLTRGYPTYMNPEHGHKFDAWIPDFIGSSNGFFHSPLGVFAEISHDVMKANDRGVTGTPVIGEISKSQLGPAYSVGRDLLFGKDFYGRPLQGLDMWSQAATDAAPIPLGIKNTSQVGGAERNLASFAGLKITPAGTKINQVYQLAGAWMRENNVKSSHENMPSEALPMRQALESGNMDKAKREYLRLIEYKGGGAHAKDKVEDAMDKWQNQTYTGSEATDDKFKASLSPARLQMYDQAESDRKRISLLFRQLKATTPIPP